jgi:hypothetical protein
LIGGFAARKVSRETTKKYFAIALIMQGLPYAFVPFCTHPTMIFFLMFFVGLCYVFVQVNMLSLVTQLVESEFRGRIFSLMYMIVSLFIPVSYIMTGLLGEIYQSQVLNLYYIAGAIVPLTWIIVLILLRSKGELKAALA